MAEIKSTMDLIMEKTKGLTMTEEEKQAFREKEMAGKVKGLIGKYLDGVLDPARLKRDLIPLEEKDRDMARRLIRQEVLDHMEIDRDNEAALILLKDTGDLDIAALKSDLTRFAHDLKRERDRCESLMMERLDRRGISGSAVLPHVEADPEWIALLDEKRREFRQHLDRFMLG